MFSRKKNTDKANNAVKELVQPKLQLSKEPKITIEDYRSLQKDLRSAKASVERYEALLKEFGVRLVKNFVLTRQANFDPFTIVELSYEGLTAVGQSRRSDADELNPDLGFKIALGRAQRKLLDKINKTDTQRDVLAG